MENNRRHILTSIFSLWVRGYLLLHLGQLHSVMLFQINMKVFLHSEFCEECERWRSVFENRTQGTTQTLLKPPKIPNAFKYPMQTPLLWHLRLIAVSVSTRLELGRSGKPLIPPSPMNVWFMPAGCHDSKIWFFPLMEMTDDNAPGESWLPFRSLHVALIARLMESAWKWGLSIHLVSPERVSRTAVLSFQGNEPLRHNSAIAFRSIVKKCLSCHICFFLTNVLITTRDRTAPWTSTAPNRTSRLHWGLQVTRDVSRVSTYLNHTHAGVQENGSFGLFGDLLIFVKVQVIGTVPKLGQVEIPPLEGLQHRAEMGFAGKNKH